MNTETFVKRFRALEKLQQRVARTRLDKHACIQLLDELTELLADKTYTYEQLTEIASLFGTVLHPYKEYIDEHGSQAEAMLTKMLLENKTFQSLDSIFWCNPYPAFMQEEAILGSVGPDDTVLHIGSGPVPITAMCYAQYVGCEYVGIEKDLPSIDMATELITELGLAERVSFIHATGETAHLSGYSHIIIGWFTYPKAAIYKHVFETADPETVIIGRVNECIGNIFYADDTLAIAEACGFKKVAQAAYSNKITTSILLERA